MRTIAKVENEDGKVTLHMDKDGSYGVTASINGKYRRCYGLTEKTACKRYSKYTNELALIYMNK